MRPTARAASIRHALKHGAGSEFSAVIKPEDCSLLVAMYDHYYELLEAQHGGIRTVRHQAEGAARDQGGSQAHAPA